MIFFLYFNHIVNKQHAHAHTLCGDVYCADTIAIITLYRRRGFRCRCYYCCCCFFLVSLCVCICFAYELVPSSACLLLTHCCSTFLNISLDSIRNCINIDTQSRYLFRSQRVLLFIWLHVEPVVKHQPIVACVSVTINTDACDLSVHVRAIDRGTFCVCVCALMSMHRW